MLGTTKRKDGTIQVTYDGQPLYTYVGDKKPGEANGNDFDAVRRRVVRADANGEEPEDERRRAAPPARRRPRAS